MRKWRGEKETKIPLVGSSLKYDFKLRLSKIKYNRIYCLDLALNKFGRMSFNNNNSLKNEKNVFIENQTGK